MKIVIELHLHESADPIQVQEAAFDMKDSLNSGSYRPFGWRPPIECMTVQTIEVVRGVTSP